MPGRMPNFLMGYAPSGSSTSSPRPRPAGVCPCDDHPLASKAVVDSMPTAVVAARHVGADSHHCAVCKEAREMPNGYMYHQDCILPWLVLCSSSPVRRHKLRGAAVSDIQRRPGEQHRG